MRDDERGAALSVFARMRFRQRMLDRGFGFVVDGGRGFIEHEDCRIAIQGTRERDALALSARELRATFANRARVAVWQRNDEAMRFRRACSGFHFRHVWRAVAIGDVVGDAAIGKEGLLRNIADDFSQCSRIESGNVLPIERDRARLRIDKAQQQFQQRALAAAGAAD